MEKYYFFNSKNGDRVYNADSFADAFSPLFRNGVFREHLQVAANNDMSITIAAGYAFINGRTYHNTEEKIINIDINSSTLDRVDAVVIRLDTLQRNITAMVIAGNNAENPTAPDLVRDSTYYDLEIAEIRVRAGEVAITQADITDTRARADVCGWVDGQAIDITKIRNELAAVEESVIENQGAIDALKKSVSNGKSLVASAITDKGVETDATATFDEMAEHIKNIQTDVAGKVQSNWKSSIATDTTISGIPVYA